MSDVLGCITVIVVVILLMFLFWGGPDLFDAIRNSPIDAVSECP